MDLILFSIFLALSLILIALGLLITEHTELALIGFVFLFLLSMLMINSDIQYKVGTQTNITNTLDPSNSSILTSQITTVDTYATFTANTTLGWLGRTLSHVLGYWLAIASIVGFVGVLMGYRRGAKF